MARLKKYRTDFSGAFALRDSDSKKRSILISGTPRGGTSFAASVYRNLGVPISLGLGDREVCTITHENRELRTAFQERDAKTLRKLTKEFSSRHDVWAWKLPGLHHDLEFAVKNVPNPHFVFIYKEPVSIAFRRNDIVAADFTKALQKALKEYLRLAKFAEDNPEIPVMFISYDVARNNMASFLEDAAAYAHVKDFDAEAVMSAIMQDGENYYPEKPPAEAAAAE